MRMLYLDKVYPIEYTPIILMQLQVTNVDRKCLDIWRNSEGWECGVKIIHTCSLLYKYVNHARLAMLFSWDRWKCLDVWFHYENTPVQIYWKFFRQKNKTFQIKNSEIFHISAQNIDCGYSLEPPRRGSSIGTHNLYFWAEIKKK